MMICWCKFNLIVLLFLVATPFPTTGQCTKPNLTENAVLHESVSQQDSFPEGSSARLSCFPGYEQESGPRTVTCQGGSWNPNPLSFICISKVTSSHLN